jgi:LSU ribosomal protein L44E
VQNVIHILNKRSPFTKLEKDVVLQQVNVVTLNVNKVMVDKKFPKLAKPAKVTKKVTPLMTCTVCKKKYNKKGVRIKKFELVAA